MKAIATSGAGRDALLPNVPTSRESGVDGMELESWLGLFAPARTTKTAGASLPPILRCVWMVGKPVVCRLC